LYLMRGTEGYDEASLRQGDILAGVPFPLLEHAKTHVLGGIAREYDYVGLPAISPKTHEHRTDKGWVTVQIPARFGFCAVLSNCCDLELRNGQVQAYAVTLARLRPVSDEIRNDPVRFASLSANRDPRDTKNPGYIPFFYLEPHNLLEGQDWNVHYNQVVTVPTSDFALLLRKKRLQMGDRARVKFKIKLAYAYGRINDDEEKAGLENPWQEPPAPADEPQA
jgi:hypothetical protein